MKIVEFFIFSTVLFIVSLKFIVFNFDDAVKCASLFREFIEYETKGI